jgi:hypothetical protein
MYGRSLHRTESSPTQMAWSRLDSEAPHNSFAAESSTFYQISQGALLLPESIPNVRRGKNLSLILVHSA